MAFIAVLPWIPIGIGKEDRGGKRSATSRAAEKGKGREKKPAFPSNQSGNQCYREVDLECFGDGYDTFKSTDTRCLSSNELFNMNALRIIIILISSNNEHN